jgi:hypothetical protein
MKTKNKRASPRVADDLQRNTGRDNAPNLLHRQTLYPCENGKEFAFDDRPPTRCPIAPREVSFLKAKAAGIS